MTERAATSDGPGLTSPNGHSGPPAADQGGDGRTTLRSVGVFTNRPLLGGIAVALAFAAAVIYLPALRGFFGTAALAPAQLATVAPFPFIVWGADETRRLLIRRHRRGSARPADRRGAGGPARIRRRQ